MSVATAAMSRGLHLTRCRGKAAEALNQEGEYGIHDSERCVPWIMAEWEWLQVDCGSSPYSGSQDGDLGQGQQTWREGASLCRWSVGDLAVDGKSKGREEEELGVPSRVKSSLG